MKKIKKLTDCSHEPCKYTDYEHDYLSRGGLLILTVIFIFALILGPFIGFFI